MTSVGRRRPLVIGPGIALWIALASCTHERVSLGDDRRGPLPEQDRTGSCAGRCGQQSDGNCWCDEPCSGYGDCCGDKVAACGGAAAACATIGADCLESFDPLIAPDCEAEFGRSTIDATCPAPNQSCCL